ncbi:hypothetical protein PGB90_002132 [Kerria lacca]
MVGYRKGKKAVAHVGKGESASGGSGPSELYLEPLAGDVVGSRCPFAKVQ